MAVTKRSEKNSSLYKQINDQSYDEFNRDLNYFLNKDRTYYDAVRENINGNLVQSSLYATNALSDEQKYVRMREQINRWSSQLKEMINQVDSSSETSLDKSQWYLNQDQIINDLYAKVFSSNTDYEIKEKMADEFASHYKKHNVTDAKVWIQKQVDIENNKAYKEFLKKQMDSNKFKLGNAKRALENYKIKWIWYVIPLVVLFIGAILCIVLPAVL